MPTDQFEELAMLSTLAQWATEKGFFADPSAAKLLNSKTCVPSNFFFFLNLINGICYE